VATSAAAVAMPMTTVLNPALAALSMAAIACASSRLFGLPFAAGLRPGGKQLQLPRRHCCMNDFNGIEVDWEGRVYASELNGNRILRYDPLSNRSDQISKDVIEMPNGLALNPSFDMLYVSNWGGHDPPTLHRIPIRPDGPPARPRCG
jgi:hypothetical protein